MNDDIRRWQHDAKAAFDWLAEMYEQAQQLWTDAEAYFKDAGWAAAAWGGYGGVAMSQSDMKEWPFFYLKAMTATRAGLEVTYPCSLPIFGISFYDGITEGPMVFAGCSRWANAPTQGHWVAYYARTLEKARFERRDLDDPIRNVVATAAGRAKYPGIIDLRWFDVPLAWISDAARLKQLVHAAGVMASGDDAPARAVCAALSDAP